MTIPQAVLAELLPVTALTWSAGLIHKYGFWRCWRAMVAAAWALSFALPHAVHEFRRIFADFFSQAMQRA
jgi:hypothetical protein